LRVLPRGLELGQPALEERRKQLVSLAGVCGQGLSKLCDAGRTVAEPSARPTGEQRAYSLIEPEAVRSADFKDGVRRAAGGFGIVTKPIDKALK